MVLPETSNALRSSPEPTCLTLPRIHKYRLKHFPPPNPGNRLQRAALLAEIVGGAAVVVSLIFVGVQLRENANVLEAQAVFDLREANGSLVRDLTGNPELSEMLFRGYNDYAALSE